MTSDDVSMPRIKQRWLALVVLAVAALFAPPAVAANLAPSADPARLVGGTDDGPQPSFLSTLTDVLEASGRLIVEQFDPQPPEVTESFDSLESPRHTVMTFIEAMEEVELGHDGHWKRALSTLELEEDVPGRVRAEQLEEILQRFGEIEPMRLPGPSDVDRRNMTRYELFPRGLDHIWVWRALGEAPKGTLVLHRGRDGKWRFSAKTVSNLPRLHESMVRLPPRFGANQDGQQLFLSTFGHTVERTAWWEVLVLLGCLVGGGLTAWGTSRLIHRGADRLHAKNRHGRARTLRGMAGPLCFLLFSAGLGVGLAFIHMGGTLGTLRRQLLTLLVALGIGWLVYRLIDLLTVFAQSRHWERDRIYRTMTLRVFRSALQVSAVTVVIAFVAEKVFRVQLGTLLVGLGVIGLMLSLAGKDSVKNLFGAVTIFVNRPFQVGDWVAFDGHVGEVQDVSMQATRIQLLSGHLLTVPNMRFIEKEVENYTERPFIRRIMDLRLPLHSSADELQRAVNCVRTILCDDDEVVSQGKLTTELRTHVSITDFAEDYVNLRAYYCYRFADDGSPQRDSNRGWYDYLEHCTLVNRKIVAAFDEAGLQLALPRERVVLEGPELGSNPTLRSVSHGG